MFGDEREAVEVQKELGMDASADSELHTRLQEAEKKVADGEMAAATVICADILQDYPGHPLAATRLARINGYSPRLYRHFFQAIHRQEGADVPWFHVSAVNVARKKRQPVPEVWEEGAAFRINALIENFDSLNADQHEEVQQLARCLVKWYRVRKKLRKIEKIRKYSRCGLLGFFRSLVWPGTIWIPKLISVHHFERPPEELIQKRRRSLKG